MRGRVLWLALAAACAATVAVSSVAACDGDRATSSISRAESAATIPERAQRRPRRILSLAPSATEILFAIGAGPQVVGVDAFSDFPAAARRLPRVGGLLDPDLERMLALQPDLAVLLSSQGELQSFLRAAGVPTLSVPHEELADVLRAIDAIGGQVGRVGEARALADSLRRALQREAVPRGREPRPRVLFVVAREPTQMASLTAAGGGTYIDELIRLAGGRNVLEGRAPRYPQLSAESLLRLAPDVVLEWSPPPVSGRDSLAAWDRRVAREWRQLADLPAVRAGAVHVLHEDLWLRPGPRVVEALVRLKALL